MRACGGLCTGAENGVKKMKIVLQNLTKTFPGRGRKDRNDVTAVDDLSCEIPEVGFSSPQSRFSVVLFPQPEGPSRAISSPSGISQERSSTAVTSF